MKNVMILLVSCMFAVQCVRGDVFGSLDSDKGRVFGNDEVRCYCNMAECITTGYMCKSNNLGCFSDLAAVTSPSSIEMVTHGCLDLLDKSLQNTCRNLPGNSDGPSLTLENGAPKSLLLCCMEDMCNDVDVPGNRIDLSNQVFNSSDSLFSEKTAGKMRRPNLTFDTVLFRLATFTVPVLGALILFMLVTLAIKLLRSDSNEDRMVAMKLSQNDAASLLLNKRHFPNGTGNLNDFEASSKKAPLLYQYDRTHLPPASYPGNRVNLLYPVLPRHYVEKNKTNAKLNNVSAPYSTVGSNLEQPLLKINSGSIHSQGTCNFGPVPLWGGGISNNWGQAFCHNESGVATTLNSFVPSTTISTNSCQLDTTTDAPGSDGDNLSESCAKRSCSSEYVAGDAATSGTDVETSGTVAASSGTTPDNVEAASSAASGNVSFDSGTISCKNVATPGAISRTETFASPETVSSPGPVESSESAATSSNHLVAAEPNSPSSGCDLPSKSSSQDITFRNLQSSSSPQHHTQNILPCSSSSFLGVTGANVPSLPTVFGPFACVTTQATSDEHPIYSLQKSSEHPVYSFSKSLPACGTSNQISCCGGCSHKCFDKSFGSHGCNLCQGVSNDRLVANSSSSACNNFDSADDTKLSYKKNLMPPFCSN